jgi:hypothetical protein
MEKVLESVVANLRTGDCVLRLQSKKLLKHNMALTNSYMTNLRQVSDIISGHGSKKFVRGVDENDCLYGCLYWNHNFKEETCSCHLLLKRRHSHSCVDGAEVSIHYSWRQQHRLRALETYLAGQLRNEFFFHTFGFVFTMG